MTHFTILLITTSLVTLVQGEAYHQCGGSAVTSCEKLTPNNGTKAAIPQNDKDANRESSIAYKRQGITYDIPLIGEKSSYFPNGTLGDFRCQFDMCLWNKDRTIIEYDIGNDTSAVLASIQASGGLNTLDDYANALYLGKGGLWNNSDPRHPALGILTNYTQDLFFGMERLTQNPYALSFVGPDDQLVFELDDTTAKKVSGHTLEELQKNRVLYAVDHAYQKDSKLYPLATVTATLNNTQKYSMPATAYFYLSDKDSQLLPLAIKTNIGANLTYTPLDEPVDWLFAKMAFNVADSFHAQMYHLTATHDVAQIVHEAAMRTLADNHPIMIVLDRLMHQAYSAPIVGENLCFNPKGHWDQSFSIDQTGTRNFVNAFYPTAGRYQANYLKSDFQSRGLLDAEGKSKFASFPFYEDASKVVGIQHTFFASFVDAYYNSDVDIASDNEVAAWVHECNTEAAVLDFPANISDKQTLTAVLTHFAWLQVAHHSLNSGDPVRSKLTLPFHPGSLHAPLPEQKSPINTSIDELVKYLPSPADAVNYIGFLSSFNRPQYATEDPPRTLHYAYSGTEFLDRFESDTVKEAADAYKVSMEAFGREVEGRNGFDEEGMCKGMKDMPFCWDALQPLYVPWFFSV